MTRKPYAEYSLIEEWIKHALQHIMLNRDSNRLFLYITYPINKEFFTAHDIDNIEP